MTMTVCAKNHQDSADRNTNDRNDEIGREPHEPTMRLHLWLETREGIFFGAGRAFLLAKIEEHGSLKKAAEDLGMSYRAAWGKIRATEEILGVKLIAQKGCKKEGHRLTKHGLLLKEKFRLWFDAVEEEALRKAREIFPWPIRAYVEKAQNKSLRTLLALMMVVYPFETLIEAVI